MRYDYIRVVNNGLVIGKDNGDEYIAKSLTEAAQIVGEQPVGPVATTYAPEYSLGDLHMVRDFVREGKKIEAIKKLRDTFNPRLGLREAKELVEVFWLHN